MNNKPENWEVVEVSDNLLDNFSSFISYEVRSNRGHTVAKSLTQNDASLVASAPEMLEMLKICFFQNIRQKISSLKYGENSFINLTG